MTSRLDLLNSRRDMEIAKLTSLKSSQCAALWRSGNASSSASFEGEDLTCRLVFNTSSLQVIGMVMTPFGSHTPVHFRMEGAIGVTRFGTEVAVFTFDQIELGPEVNVTVVGQRPLVLLSRSMLLLNTTIAATPGTLGGFPGGV